MPQGRYTLEDVTPAASYGGNIDLRAQPRVKNPDGSTSTVRSISINEDGVEILIPTVVGNRVVSDADAVKEYHRTGRHLGKFRTAAEANRAAAQLHDDYAAGQYDAAQSGQFSAADMEEGVPSSMSSLDRLVDLLPEIGGTLGGFVGKVPSVRILSSGIGGAAGQGYKEMFQHLRELPGAVADVSRNLIVHPRETAKGFVEGATEGGKDALKQGVLQSGAQAVGEGGAKVIGGSAKAVYRGFLKPSIAAKNAPKAAQIVETALREGLPISRAGAVLDDTGKIGGKAGQVITALQGEVDAEIASAGGTIDLKRIADRVRRVARQRYYRPGADPADYKIAKGVADRIDKYASKKLTNVVTVAKGNEAKKALQEAARGSFGSPNATAKKTMEKVGARKLRIAIEGATGGRSGSVAMKNARTSKLIDAAKAIAQAVEREANQSALHGVKTLAAGAVGGGLGYQEAGAPGALAGTIAARTALRPAVASRAAIVASRIAKQLGVSAALATRLAEYALSENPEEE